MQLWAHQNAVRFDVELSLEKNLILKVFQLFYIESFVQINQYCDCDTINNPNYPGSCSAVCASGLVCQEAYSRSNPICS